MMIVNSDNGDIITYDDGAVRKKDIRAVDYSQLEHHQTVLIKVDGNAMWHKATDFNAIMVVYAMSPTWLEGKPFIKWKKNSWIVHNLIAHPLMQLLAFARLYKLAMRVHDSTVPRPIGFK